MFGTRYKLILASGSPRRKFLLETAGLDFEIKKNEVDESYPEGLEIDKIAEYLARKKASGNKSLLQKDELLLTADTMVAFMGKEYGKPENKEHSIQMLCALGGQIHTVFTGVCISDGERLESFSVKSRVKFDKIDESEASWYYDNFKPMDKAGSYGIQDWIGYCKVEWIEGSYTNILGLPLTQTLKALKSFIESHH